MFKKMTIVLLAFVLSGCAYNSRNLFAITGNGMSFSYGLISIKNADKIILLRETNMGEGEAKYNIPDMGQYMCPIKSGDSDPAIKSAVIYDETYRPKITEVQSIKFIPAAGLESKEADLLEMNEIKPPEPVEPVNL